MRSVRWVGKGPRASSSWRRCSERILCAERRVSVGMRSWKAWLTWRRASRVWYVALSMMMRIISTGRGPVDVAVVDIGCWCGQNDL